VVAVCRGSIACPVAAVKEWLAAASIVEPAGSATLRRALSFNVPIFLRRGGGRQIDPDHYTALAVESENKFVEVV
jgi:hypothetical protein